MRSRWSERDAAEFQARYEPGWDAEVTSAAYSAHLLRDQEIGGSQANVSVKGTWTNILGESLPALFFWECGGRSAPSVLDLAYLGKLRILSSLNDHQMLQEFRTHTFDSPAGVPPPESLVHAFLPMKHAVHVHAGPLSALTEAPDGCASARRALGDHILVLPFCQPGFDLAKSTVEAYDANPKARAAIWRHHGMLTWGETASAAYSTAIDVIDEVEEWLERQARRPVQVAAHTSQELARERAQQVAPVLRGLLGEAMRHAGDRLNRIILQPVIDGAILDLLASPGGRELAVTPPVDCRHLRHAKPLPIWVADPHYADSEILRSQLSEALAAYSREYEVYHSRNAGDGARPPDSCPRIVLLPGLGALCGGPDLGTSSLVRDVARCTLTVRAGMAGYDPLPEAELFRMEHAPIEQSENRSTPQLAGRVALVTGAAGAIGAGISEGLLRQGCAVALADLPGARLESLWKEFHDRYGDLAMALPFDVTEPAQVAEAFGRVILAWGGLDLIVINAGVALVCSLEEMDLEAFRRLERINIEGTLNLLSAAARHFRLQGAGGDVVLISTKNVFAPGAKFGAYSATKAAAHQLARIASLELAELGVRVNMVAPDAVFAHGDRGSGLWAEVGPGRARSKGLQPNELEEHYRQRNLLKSKIAAADVGNAVLYFATHQSPTTGATIPVDGGLPEATPR